MEIKEVEQMAKDVLIKIKKHPQQMIIEKPDGKVDMVLLSFDNKDKDKMLDELRETIANSNIQKYFFITEAWKSEDIHSCPSKADDKEEILVISEFRRDMKNKVVFLDFKRVKGEIVFTDRKEIESGKSQSESYSRYNFFVEDVLDEVVMKAQVDESLKCITDDVVKKATKKAREYFDNNDISEDMVRDKLENMVKKGRFYLKKKNSLDNGDRK